MIAGSAVLNRTTINNSVLSQKLCHTRILILTLILQFRPSVHTLCKTLPITGLSEASVEQQYVRSACTGREGGVEQTEEFETLSAASAERYPLPIENVLFYAEACATARVALKPQSH